MERIVFKCMINFLDYGNPTLKSSQHGLCQGRFTDTAGVIFIDFLTRNMHCDKVAVIIFRDFAKAFDFVASRVPCSDLCFLRSTCTLTILTHVPKAVI